MKYIVTGGAGFIGSHIVDALIKNGHKVLIIDSMVTGKKENINPKAEFHKVDIINENDIEPLFKGVDGVFHTAALARIQPSFHDPDLYFRINAIGTRNVLACAKKYKVRRVIYSASSSAYGVTALPANESAKVTTQAFHPYGSTKRMGEMLMSDMGIMTSGPETVCLRYFNVYGRRQNTEVDGPYPTVIGLFLGLLKKGKPLSIVPDGHQRRDFTWVGDIVRANIMAMGSKKVGEAEIINVGCGMNYSIWDVAKLVLSVSRKTSEKELLKNRKCIMAPLRRNEVFETRADISKAKKLLGWEPKMKFEKGIQELLRG